MDRRFLLTGFIYAIFGLLLGIYMAASKNHGQYVTHAHIMLIGFVLSFVYALCHKLWLTNNSGKLAKIQFTIHQLGALVVLVGLFLLYGQILPLATLDPILAIASIAVFIGVLLMTVMLWRDTAS